MKKELKRQKSDVLSEVFNPKNNSFTIISIIMSILILYFHAYPLFYGANSSQVDFLTRNMVGDNVGSIVVNSFFLISGFMITTSIRKSKSTWQYLKKRIIKIFPPLIFCLVICAMVVAPIISDISKLEFLKTPSLYYHYILDNILLWRNTVYSIADVFVNNPYVSAINGSIWTIKHQFFMYLLMIVINFVILKKRPELYKYFLGFIIVLTMISYTGYYDSLFGYIATILGTIGIFAEGKLLLKLVCYFCIGVFINLNQDKLRFNFKNFVFVVIITLLSIRTPVFQYLSFILLPYIIIYLGCLKSKVKLIDISYQIYIWGFPIQQIIMYYYNGKINIGEYILFSIIATVTLAFFTFYITEWPFKKGNLSKLFIKKELNN